MSELSTPLVVPQQAPSVPPAPAAANETSELTKRIAQNPTKRVEILAEALKAHPGHEAVMVAAAVRVSGSACIPGLVAEAVRVAPHRAAEIARVACMTAPLMARAIRAAAVLGAPGEKWNIDDALAHASRRGRFRL